MGQAAPLTSWLSTVWPAPEAPFWRLQRGGLRQVHLLSAGCVLWHTWKGERAGVTDFSKNMILSGQTKKRKEYKEHEERKPRVSEAATLTFPAQEDSRWLPRGIDNWTVGTDISEGSFTVAKNFGGRIRVIYCLHTPCRSGDTVAV